MGAHDPAEAPEHLGAGDAGRQPDVDFRLAEVGGQARSLPLVATAERVLGTAVGANLVGLGALVALSGAVPADAVERVVERRRPGGSAERALRAFRAGVGLALAQR